MTEKKRKKHEQKTETRVEILLRKEIARLEDAESQSSEIPFGMDINDARMLQAYCIAQAALQTKPLNNIHEKYDYFTDTACLLTSEEQKIAQLLGDAWNLYLTCQLSIQWVEMNFAGQFIIAKI
ncbi:hypothetical protein OHD05_08505 [Escherichia coli]|uniref:hypothetical protein n=1 Tax=Escherichia coli TaxID=562 RepID=UPI0022374559|nr:hypothetical protein [Escherichia coli]MCW7307144.1 hypothetical protein [Escherichia coli]